MDKVRVIFVDDDPNILAGLRRYLRAMRDHWDVAFCEAGAEALDLMARQSFDVVVSDMRMPNMDGAEFLGLVRKRHPGTIRVILSGYADSDCVLRTVGPAHVYLAKPCDPATLVGAIARPLALRRHLAASGLRDTLAEISSLPSPPELFHRIEEELHSPRSSAASIAAIIAQDMAMTAEILKMTNSAYFSLALKVTTPLQAVKTLGLEIVHTLVLRIGIFRQFEHNGSDAAQVAALNDYGMRLGALAEAIATAENGDPSTAKAAYCAGMLSSLGSLVLLDSRPRDYNRVLATMAQGRPLHVAEQEAFGASHAMIGAYLLGLWGFNDPVVEAVAYADHPSACTGRDSVTLAAVHAARALGPPYPLLPTETGGTELDTSYLIEANLASRLPDWRALAAAQSRKA